MEFFSLVPHPAAVNVPAIDIYAVALIVGSGRAAFRYRVRGDVKSIRLPATRTKAERTDDLWRHTCFEAFVAQKNSERYAELNFSPSSEWAAYTFEKYRYNMQPLPVMRAPAVQLKIDPEVLAFDVTVQMRSLAADSVIGLTAVIESIEGSISHWAVAHPVAKPDFHDARAWTAAFQRLTAEDRL